MKYQILCRHFSFGDDSVELEKRNSKNSGLSPIISDLQIAVRERLRERVFRTVHALQV